jgi:hypothetical protein
VGPFWGAGLGGRGADPPTGWFPHPPARNTPSPPLLIDHYLPPYSLTVTSWDRALVMGHALGPGHCLAQLCPHCITLIARHPLGGRYADPFLTESRSLMSRRPKPLVSPELVAWVFSLPMHSPSCAGPAPAPRRNVVAEFILNQG